MRLDLPIVALIALTAFGCEGTRLDWRDPVSRKVDRSNRQFAEGRLDEALVSYRDAQIDAVEAGEVHFNVGDVLYSQRKYEDAEEAFTVAQAKGGRGLQARAVYNAGNAQFRQDRLDKAAESYQRALELDPGDMDAKFNLELVQRLLNQAAQRAAGKQGQNSQRPKVSEWARLRARQAESLASQGRYAEAQRIMERTLEAEPAAAAEFRDFTDRLSDLARIFGAHQRR
jgi:Ca-activated chloride channel family protein